MKPGLLPIALLLNLLLALLPDVASALSVRSLDDDYAALEDGLWDDAGSVLEVLLAEPPGDDTSPVRQAQYQLLLSLAYDSLTYPNESLASADQGLTLIRKDAEPWLYHSLHVARSRALDLLGRAEEALPHLSAAYAWAEDHENRELELLALATRGLLQTSRLDYLSALTDLQEAYALAPEKDGQTVKAHVANYLGLIYEYRSEDELAIPYYQEYADYMREQDNKIELSIALYGLGRAQARTGNPELGRRTLEESAEAAKAAGDEQGVAYALKELGGLALQRGEGEVAADYLRRAEIIFAKAENIYMLLDINKALAQAAIAEDDLASARAYVEKARSWLDPDAMRRQALTLRRLEAQILAAEGDHQTAYEISARVAQERRELQTERSTKQLHELRTRYEVQAREIENELLERENELARAQLEAVTERSRLQAILLGLGAALLVALALLFQRTRQHRKRLEVTANTDALTGLPNRRRTLEQLHAKLQQEADETWTVAILDLDHFKRINDEHGHIFGDRVLKRFARVGRSWCQAGDTLGRIGGEEFLVILNGADIDKATRRLDELRTAASTVRHRAQGKDLCVTLSAGVCGPEPGDAVSDILARADRLLYRAKESGRDRVEAA